MNYYDEMYKNGYSTERYENLYLKIGQLAIGKVLDIGCGTAELSRYIKNYRGFDFSKEAIKEANNKNVWVGNIYKESNIIDADTYVFCEVLEHIEYDKEVLASIAPGKRVLITVPSFSDPAHIRTYKDLKCYDGIIKVKKTITFYWHDKWEENGEKTPEFILLCEGVRI